MGSNPRKSGQTPGNGVKPWEIGSNPTGKSSLILGNGIKSQEIGSDPGKSGQTPWGNRNSRVLTFLKSLGGVLVTPNPLTPGFFGVTPVCPSPQASCWPRATRWTTPRAPGTVSDRRESRALYGINGVSAWDPGPHLIPEGKKGFATPPQKNPRVSGRKKKKKKRGLASKERVSSPKRKGFDPKREEFPSPQGKRFPKRKDFGPKRKDFPKKKGFPALKKKGF